MPHTGVEVFVFLFFNFLFCIEIEPIINISVVIFSDEQQRDSALRMHVSILLQLPSHPGSHIHQAEFPMLYNRSLLVIRFNRAVCPCPSQSL